MTTSAPGRPPHGGRPGTSRGAPRPLALLLICAGCLLAGSPAAVAVAQAGRAVLPAERTGPAPGAAAAATDPAPRAAAAPPAAAGAAAPTADAPNDAGWRLPLAGLPRVVRPFAPPAQRWELGHRGVDLAAAPGALVRSAGAGTVLYAGRLADRGVVSVRHTALLRTTYEPVRPLVRAGQRVRAGAPIGVLSGERSHCSPAVTPDDASTPGDASTPDDGSSCLHWGLLRGEEYLDPMALLGTPRSRLLPVWGIPVPGGT